MTASWMLAVETAADALGEMLIEIAEGRGDHSNEDIAAAVLTTGLTNLLGRDPAADRLEEVASVLHAKLHYGGEQSWTSLTQVGDFGWISPVPQYVHPMLRCCTRRAVLAHANPE